MQRLVKHRVNRTRTLLAGLLVFSLTLIGCGDDSSDQFFPSIQDFRVISTIPNAGEINIDPFDQIQIRMSQPVAPGSLAGNVRVTLANTGEVVPGNASTTEADTVIVFTPATVDGSLPGNSQIRVELLTGLQSITGSSLFSPFTLFFTTGAGSGLSSTSKPGVPPVLLQVIPAFEPIPAGFYSFGSGYLFELIFSECIPINSLEVNLRVEKEDVTGIFEQQLPSTVDSAGFSDNQFLVYISGALNPLDELKLTILGGLEDCNTDLIAAPVAFKYTVF